MREKTNKMSKKGMQLVMLTAVCSITMTNFAFATVSTSGSAAATDVLAGINALKTLFLGIISVIGAFTAGKGILDLSGAIPAQDSNSIKLAIATLAGGLIAFFGAGILALMGIS